MSKYGSRKRRCGRTWKNHKPSRMNLYGKKKKE
jgi:hypothetical protein